MYAKALTQGTIGGAPEELQSLMPKIKRMWRKLSRTVLNRTNLDARHATWHVMMQMKHELEPYVWSEFLRYQRNLPSYMIPGFRWNSQGILVEYR